jgi:hypothetical protein
VFSWLSPPIAVDLTFDQGSFLLFWEQWLCPDEAFVIANNFPGFYERGDSMP